MRFIELDFQFVDAAAIGRIDVIRDSIEGGRFHVDCQNNGGDTALMHASYFAHKEIIDLLLTHGCDVHLKNKRGWTALLYAASNGHKEVCELLISRGCAIDHKNGLGYTAFLKAAGNGHKEVCELLNAHGCDVLAQSGDGSDALIAAARNGHREVCTWLISLGWELDIHDASDHWTAFIYACWFGHDLIAITLIEAGCNYSHKTKKGSSGMDYLMSRHPDKVKVIQVTPSHRDYSLVSQGQTNTQYYFCNYFSS